MTLGKVRLKTAVKPKKKGLINFKVNPTEEKLIQLKANKYAGGNVSEWLRYAGIHCEPKASDLTHVPAKRADGQSS